MDMNNTTENTNSVYVLAIDWEDGRTPSYEAHIRWMCTKDEAIKFFRKSHEGYGLRRALIAPDGTIIETCDAA